MNECTCVHVCLYVCMHNKTTEYKTVKLHEKLVNCTCTCQIKCINFIQSSVTWREENHIHLFTCIKSNVKSCLKLSENPHLLVVGENSFRQGVAYQFHGHELGPTPGDGEGTEKPGMLQSLRSQRVLTQLGD